MQLPATVCNQTGTFSVSAVLDSGAEQNLTDGDLVRQLSSEVRALVIPISVTALECQSLPPVIHQTESVLLILSTNHCKHLHFFVFCHSVRLRLH